jgi:hypothetical protein
VKYLNVTTFILLLQVSMSVVSGLGIFSVDYNPYSDWFTEVSDDRLADAEYVQSVISNDGGFLSTLGDIVKALFYFVTAVGLGVVVVPWTMIQLGLPPIFAGFLSIPVYYSYFIGISQWIGNRGTKGMD